METAPPDLAERLKDPSKWVVKTGVPTFKAHKYTSLTGEMLYEVTDADLPVIADNTAKLQSEHGVVGRITPGHINTKPGADETKQPPLYGYQCNPRMGTYGPKQKPCIVTDHYLYPEHAQAASRLPYRSADYHFVNKEIRGTAMLIRDPYLDMGTHAYEGNSFYEEVPVEPTPEQLVQLAALAAAFPDLVKVPTPKVPPVIVPAALPDAARMALESQTIQLQAVSAENAEMKKAIAQLQSDKLFAVCEQQIIQLEAEGFVLVRADEVSELASKPDQAARDKHLARIRANYKTSAEPPQGMIQLFRGPVEGTPEQLARATQDDKLAKVNQLIRANLGMAWEEAVAKVG